ncbi:hypothetical protein RBQ61_02685 [Sedimentibacter sp. MB35-C1]|uniref:hypothetical protein n=1 Tax=Sedimentibacter sp. MB35-C1 TaxID=3070995 RepID=UPI0027DF135F|nr:hypothetical protein [Sedimentibacter sp. MB35-C1]WMJ77851.1 hypothetical protein RBQ61_02685 [Sedimentibacter sp. MB35-C1]
MGTIIASLLGGGLFGIFGWQYLSPESIVDNLDKTFNKLNDIIQGAVDLVTNPIDSMEGIWDVVSSVHNAILPMGYSLLTLFFLLGFMNKSLSFRIIRIEDIIRLILKMIIAKAVMEKSFELLNMVYGIATDLILKVDFSVASIKIVDTAALAEQIDKMNFIERIVFQTQFTPISIVSFILNLMVFVICYGRIVEICIFTAVSPIPIATLSSEEYAGTAKGFFRHYFAICLHGLIIVIICMIFGGLAQTLIGAADTSDFGVGMSISLSIMLIYVLSKSESWARQIMGAH